MIADQPVLSIPEAHDLSDVSMPERITKRDGGVVAFDYTRIRRAISRCFLAVGHDATRQELDDLCRSTLNALAARPTALTVETVQNTVEVILAASGYHTAARAYILYRAEHARLREEQLPAEPEVKPQLRVKPEVKALFDAQKEYFGGNQLREFQHADKYAKWIKEKGRRETWSETIDRAVSFLREIVETNVSVEAAQYLSLSGNVDLIKDAMLHQRAMCSMRLLAMAGPAARRNNMTIYNCTYLTVSDRRCFGEALLLSMSGCGVGYSVERRFVRRLGKVKAQGHPSRYYRQGRPVYVVQDSTEGWQDAVDHGIQTWFEGDDVVFDYSQIRPAGAVLETKGGRASGPGPLHTALDFARDTILSAQGKFLTPLQVHDMMCVVGDAAVSGGVRRTALIALFDMNDGEMLNCKVGEFPEYRWNANNSAVIPPQGISRAQFDRMWSAMLSSQRGEPGLVSRQAIRNTMPKRRTFHKDMGVNPCGEIELLDEQGCNLTIVVARADDTLESLKEKVYVATLIGTIQSLAVDFGGRLRPEWTENMARERLLGVDITGQRDCPLLQDARVLQKLRTYATQVNQSWAEFFGIPQSASITTVKPSGNSAQLFGCSSGIHARYAPYYYRRVRVSATSPMFKVLRDAGVPLSPENGQTADNAVTWVATFPVKSPDGAYTRHDQTALSQVEYWKHIKENWTDHNPSTTVDYRPEEQAELAEWVWDNLPILGGMSFLPAFEIKLDQLPCEEITREQYEAAMATFPAIDFSKMVLFEVSDMTEAAQTLACVAGNGDC